MSDKSTKTIRDLPDEPTYLVAPGWMLKEKYGFTAENRPEIKLHPEKVPEKFRWLMPHAETWGIGDDLIRGDVLDKASDAELHWLTDDILPLFDEIMDEWLLPEAETIPTTNEYAAFTCLYMAADSAFHRLERKRKADS